MPFWHLGGNPNEESSSCCGSGLIGFDPQHCLSTDDLLELGRFRKSAHWPEHSARCHLGTSKWYPS